LGGGTAGSGDQTDDRSAKDFKEIREPRHFVLRYRPAIEPALLRALSFLKMDYVLLSFMYRLPRSRGTARRSWFPGYLFPCFDVRLDPWTHALRAPGVTAILGNPSPIDTDVFTDMVARCPDGLLEQNALTVIPAGSEVEVTDGAFKGRHGIVAASAGDMVWVELLVFARPTRAELKTRQVMVIR
jgi:transcription antitermination factor NusG